MDKWISLFGVPNCLLSDNGGEFVNKGMLDFAKSFNFEPKTTPAESPWSNGK